MKAPQHLYLVELIAQLSIDEIHLHSFQYIQQMPKAIGVIGLVVSS
jgi:hypothetical protein